MSFLKRLITGDASETKDSANGGGGSSSAPRSEKRAFVDDTTHPLQAMFLHMSHETYETLLAHIREKKEIFKAQAFEHEREGGAILMKLGGRAPQAEKESEKVMFVEFQSHQQKMEDAKILLKKFQQAEEMLVGRPINGMVLPEPEPEEIEAREYKGTGRPSKKVAAARAQIAAKTQSLSSSTTTASSSSSSSSSTPTRASLEANRKTPAKRRRTGDEMYGSQVDWD